MIARADVAQDGATFDAWSDRRRGEDVIDPPSDVALAHVAPRRPPGEQVLFVGRQRAADVDQMLTKQLCEELALLRSLADDIGFAFARMYIDVVARDVDVAAHDDITALVWPLPRPESEL